jgi:hypothetical protein
MLAICFHAANADFFDTSFARLVKNTRNLGKFTDVNPPALLQTHAD